MLAPQKMTPCLWLLRRNPSCAPRHVVQAENVAHHLAEMLQTYVADHGGFPPSLEQMLKDRGADPRLILPLADERTEYFPPKAGDPDTAPVVIIVGKGYRIIVGKDFARETVRE